MCLHLFSRFYSQEDRSRVEIFREYSQKKRESVWGPFLNLLNRPDEFITHMTARIIAKMACWSKELMERSDLHFYLTWLKDQLKQKVIISKFSQSLFFSFFFPILCNFMRMF